MNENIATYLEKADDDILDVQALLEKGRYTSAVSRSYYAMFHAVQAVLLSRQIEAYTHSGVSIQFQKAFIKTDIFSIELGKTLARNPS